MPVTTIVIVIVHVGMTCDLQSFTRHHQNKMVTWSCHYLPCSVCMRACPLLQTPMTVSLQEKREWNVTELQII